MSSITGPVQPQGGRARPSAAVLWGVVLVAVGLLFLGLSLGVVPKPSAAAVGAALAVAGFALVVSYPALHAHWWTLIVGPPVLALGAIILLPTGGDGWLFLAGIGAGFALVALTSAERWWAVIPAGTLLTLALVSFVAPSLDGLLAGALLFFGLAVTFGVLPLIKVRGRNMRWPLFPAFGCLVFGALLATSGTASDVIWPLVLVAAGIAIMLHSALRRRA